LRLSGVMKGNEMRISRYEVQVFELVKSARGGWLSTHDIANLSGVPLRTAQHHAVRLAKMGVFRESRLHGGFLYRMGAPRHEHAIELDRMSDVLAEAAGR
jgi:hypothetical protein